jgi:LuxR family maltose regulon positive regulatory protein
MNRLNLNNQADFSTSVQTTLAVLDDSGQRSDMAAPQALTQRGSGPYHDVPDMSESASPGVPKASRFELRRPRLLERLEHAGEARLVALIAPSGFGKTTLLAQHARSQGRRTVWVSLREDDSDAVRLMNRLQTALAPSRSAPKRTPSTTTPDPSMLAWHLARDLDHNPERLCIVLDRIDHLGPNAAHWLETFIHALSDGHRVLISGFDADLLPLARMVAEGNALVIGPEELAFDTEETRAYLALRGQTTDPNAVHATLEGWPLGLALVAGGTTAQVTPTELILETLKRLPAPLLAGVPEASVLSVWSEGAALQMGCELPVGWLNTVRRAGLPLVPLGRQTYRPLQVLLDTLETELQRNPVRHAALHRTAGIAAEVSGDTLQAIRHYQAARLDDEAVRLTERVAPQLFAQAEYRLLRQVLEQLPLERLSPAVREHLGVALTETETPARGEVVLRGLRANKQLSITGLYTLGKLALRGGEYVRALELVAEAFTSTEQDSVDAARLLRLQGFALSGLGRHDEALQVALKAIGLAESRDDLRELGQAISLAQGEHYMLGQWSACERLIRRGIEVFEALGQPMRAWLLYNDLANLECLSDRTEEAWNTIERVLPDAERERNDILPSLLETRADIHLWLGHFTEAANDYRQAAEQAARFDRTRSIRYQLKWTEAAFRSGQAHEALTMFTRLQADMPSDVNWLQGRLAFVAGLIALVGNDLGQASTHLQSALERTDDLTQKPRALAFLAEIERRAGQLEQTRLDQLFERLSAMPSDAVLRADASILSGLWVECLRQGWFVERVARVSNLDTVSDGAFNTVLDDTVPVKTEASATLELMTFGRLQVRLNNQTVRLPFAKAGELLIWLALNGPANHEQVIDALWDGSGEEKHHEYFRVAVRRLRAALRSPKGTELPFNPLPFEHGVYALASDFRVKLDASLSLHALQTNHPDDLRAALEAYRGEFLPGVDTQWATETRTRCLENTVTVALTLGEQLENTDPREALNAYRRAVELEPLSELGHLGLIRTYLRLGGLAAANQAYTAYARMLSEEFGLEPSAELRQRLADLGLRV